MINCLIFSFMLLSSVMNSSEQADSQDKKLKYLALGDSYTIGERVDFRERFPVQLTNKLKLKGFEKLVSTLTV